MSDCCPDLNIGVTIATFRFSGNAPFQSDSLTIKATGTKISSAASLSIFAGILSGPDAFASFIPFNAVRTQCFVTDLNLNLVAGTPERGAGGSKRPLCLLVGGAGGARVPSIGEC